MAYHYTYKSCTRNSATKTSNLSKGDREGKEQKIWKVCQSNKDTTKQGDTYIEDCTQMPDLSSRDVVSERGGTNHALYVQKDMKSTIGSVNNMMMGRNRAILSVWAKGRRSSSANVR